MRVAYGSIQQAIGIEEADGAGEAIAAEHDIGFHEFRGAVFADLKAEGEHGGTGEGDADEVDVFLVFGGEAGGVGQGYEALEPAGRIRGSEFERVANLDTHGLGLTVADEDDAEQEHGGDGGGPDEGGSPAAGHTASGQAFVLAESDEEAGFHARGGADAALRGREGAQSGLEAALLLHARGAVRALREMGAEQKVARDLAGFRH